MKLLLIAVALVLPSFAAAYPNPNVVLRLSTGEMVNTIYTQPYVAPTVLADATQGDKAK